MKHCYLIRLVALATVLFTSMALSCQDHNIPDPVSNCNRLNGTSRAVDCEFEIVKVEFFGGKGGRFLGTVTPGSPNLTIRESYKFEFAITSASMKFYIGMQAKITFKRIAPAPAGTTKYLFRSSITESTDPRFPYLEYDALIGFIPGDDELTQVALNVPVGDTFTYTDLRAGFQGIYSIDHKTGLFVYPVPPTWVLIQNVETSKKLRNAPYNYTPYRDQAEARFKFVPTVIASGV